MLDRESWLPAGKLLAPTRNPNRFSSDYLMPASERMRDT